MCDIIDMKNFNEMTDTWFDALVALAKKNPSIGRELTRLVGKTPSKAAVTNLNFTISHMVLVSENSAIRAVNMTALLPLSRHCQAVLDKGFRKEFRFSFGGKGYPTNLNRVSAASNLFSSIGQAANYAA